MTLGGLLKHLALVEDNWFCVVFLGNERRRRGHGVDWDADRDWEWHTAADDSPEQLRALLDEAVAAVGRDLDSSGRRRLDCALGPRAGATGEPFSLRWILVHMIEEYARHNGHADLIRESVDGATGE